MVLGPKATLCVFFTNVSTEDLVPSACARKNVNE